VFVFISAVKLPCLIYFYWRKMQFNPTRCEVTALRLTISSMSQSQWHNIFC